MISKAILTALGGFLMFAGPVHAGDATAGKAKAEDCAGCHGDDGKGDAKNSRACRAWRNSISSRP